MYRKYTGLGEGEPFLEYWSVGVHLRSRGTFVSGHTNRERVKEGIQGWRWKNDRFVKG